MMAVAGVRFSQPFGCLSVFPHYVSKIDASRITKLDIQMMSPGNLFILRSKGHKSHCQHGSLHSYECWLLPVMMADSSVASISAVDYVYTCRLWVNTCCIETTSQQPKRSTQFLVVCCWILCQD